MEEGLKYLDFLRIFSDESNENDMPASKLHFNFVDFIARVNHLGQNEVNFSSSC